MPEEALVASPEALRPAPEDSAPEHDFVGAFGQFSDGVDAAGSPIPRNPEANIGSPLAPGDCYSYGAGNGHCGWGAGTLITPSIVVGPRRKLLEQNTGFEGGWELMRHSATDRQTLYVVREGDTARHNLAWSIGSRIREADRAHVAVLNAFWEHHRSGMALHCAHPLQVGPDGIGAYAVPPPELRGTPLSRVYPWMIDPASGQPDAMTTAAVVGAGASYDIFTQVCSGVIGGAFPRVALDLDDGPDTGLALFVLRERVAPELGGPRSARPVFRLASGATDPAAAAGLPIHVFDYGISDLLPEHWGTRTTGAGTLDGEVIVGLTRRTAAGTTLIATGGLTYTLPGLLISSGESGAPQVLDAPIASPFGSASVISTFEHTFLGDSALEAWLDPDGDGFYRGELDAWNGGALPSATGPDPVNCHDSPDFDCLDHNDNCDAVWNLDQRDTDGDGIGDPCDLCPITWEPITLTDGVGREPNLDRSSLRPADRALYPAATCIAVTTNPADEPDLWQDGVPWHAAVAVGDVIGVACGEPGGNGGLTYSFNAHLHRSAQFLRVTDDLTTPPAGVVAGPAFDEAATGLDLNGDGRIDPVRELVGTDFPNYDDDGVPFLCDNCPDTPNPLQEHDDGDLIGNACEPDTDGDGIIDDLDHCPLTPDGPFNCNSDAGNVRFVTSLVDDCDPIPCARITPSATASVPVTDTPSLITEAHLRGPALIGSDPSVAQDPTVSASGHVGFRFCRCTRATTNTESARNDCAVFAGCELVRRVLGGGEVDLFPPGVAPAWRPIEARVADPADPFVSVTFHNAHPTATTIVRDVDVVWPFTTDPAALPLVDWHGSPAAQGVLWTAVRRRSGDTACSTEACERLASHYWSGLIGGGTVQGPNPALVNGTAMVPWPAPQPVCLFCDGSFPAPFLGTVCAPGTFCDPASWVLRSDRMETAAASQLSAALSKSFIDPIVTWTMPSEPREALDASAFRMVGLSFGQVVARVTALDATLGLDGESSPQLKPPAELLARAATAFAATGAPNASGRGAVLLGRSGRVFAFGGDVVERQDLVVTDLRTGQVGRTHLAGDRPGVVIAATHRVWSPAALVLDRVPPQRSRGLYERGYREAREHVRLLLVDLRASRSSEVRRIPWLSRYDRHALVTLADGDSALVASSSTTQRHVVLRFRLTSSADGTPRLRVIARAEGRGAVLAPPIASAEGLSIAVRWRDRPWSVIGYPLAPQASRSEADLDDCF